jgi:hypothetical protein
MWGPTIRSSSANDGAVLPPQWFSLDDDDPWRSSWFSTGISPLFSWPFGCFGCVFFSSFGFLLEKRGKTRFPHIVPLIFYPTLKSVYSWSESFERVRIDYPTLLHEKGIYSHQRRGKAINVRANLTPETLLVVGITTGMPWLSVNDNHFDVGHYKSAKLCFSWTETCGLGLTCYWAELDAEMSSDPATIWYLFVLRRVELYACIHSQCTYTHTQFSIFSEFIQIPTWLLEC